MKFYRFSDYLIETNRVKIAEEHFELVKETPCGYWITSQWYTIPDFNMTEEDINYKYCHWVSKKAKKRFAYPDRKQALESFLKRKERQVKILDARLKTADTALRKAKVLLDNFEE